MAIIIGERLPGKESTFARSQVEYIVRATEGETEEQIREDVISTVPDFNMGLPRQEVRLSEQGPGTYQASVTYSSNPGSISPPPGLGEATETFDSTGGTIRITHSLEVTDAKPAPGFSFFPDFEGGIGNGPNGPEGIDIVSRVYTWTRTVPLAESVVTYSYRGVIFALTGRTNDAEFYGFEAGEVLFLGASGQRRTSTQPGVPAPWDITYRFAASPNATVDVGPIAGLAKGGWEYVDAYTEVFEDEDAKVVVHRPIAAYVHRVYESGDFSQLILE